MKDLIHEYPLGDGRFLRICREVYPDDPRSWDNLGTMVCWHRRYTLGDEHDYKTPEAFLEFIRRNAPRSVILPVFLYDHSGITVSTVPFTCRFDSGQVGFIYVTPDRIREEYGASRISAGLRKRVEDILRAEVETYDQYLRGDVYGFVLEKETVCDVCQIKSVDQEDSCWGFFGDDITVNGILDHLSNEDALKVMEQVNG